MNPSVYVRSIAVRSSEAIKINIDLNIVAPELKVLVMVFLLLISALGVVSIKDCNRRLFMEQHRMKSQYDKLQAENNKLLLEQSAWAAQERVQMVAQQELEMQIPLSVNIKVIKT